MTDMSWEHAAEARQALNAIVSDPQHGVAALSSAQTMSNLLKDLLPDAPREKSILVAAAEAGLADTLRQHVGQGMDPDTAIRLTASSFSSTTPFTPEACSWVAAEIATALGMRHSGGAGGAPGGFAGAQSGFDTPGQAAPTQVAPIPGYAPGQQPTQGIPQVPGPGGAAPTAPGPRQSGPAQPGQPGGGFGQPPTGGGFGQGQPAGGGFGQGQPAAGGWQGQQQAGFGQAQPGAGFGQPGGGQPGGGWQAGAPGGYAPGGYQPAGPTGPMGPIIPGGPGGPMQPRRRGRGLAIAGGIVGAGVVAIVIAVSLSGGNSPKPPPNPTPTPPVSTTPPTPTPSPTNPPGTEPLATIMNPAGETPVGTHCGAARLFHIDKSTLVASTFCSHSHSYSHVGVWGYQFDSSADYKAGLAKVNSFVGFDNATPASSCPPPSGSTEGRVGWHAIHNPKYFRHSGQDIECLYNSDLPVLVWTMPTQDVFFLADDRIKGTTLTTLIDWWKKLSYG